MWRRVLDRGEVCVLKFCEGLILEGSVDVTTFVVSSTLFGVLEEERLIVGGGCSRWDVWCATGVGRADEWVSGDKGLLICCQNEPEVAVLSLAAGLLIVATFLMTG